MTKPRFLIPGIPNPQLPLWVFLPGMDGMGDLFANQVEQLAPFFDLRCLQLPRNDLSNWDVLSKQVIALIKAELAQTMPRPVYLCGESFGACLAMQVSTRVPQLVSRLILVNSASCFHERPLLGWGVPFTGMMPELIYRFSASILLPFLIAPHKVEPCDRNALCRAMKSVSPQTVSWRLSLLKNFSLPENQLRRLVQPTLLIAGGADRLLPSADEAERLSKGLPQAYKVILPESGHACLLEKDIQLYEIIKAAKFPLA